MKMKVLFLAPASSVHTIRWVNALADKGCSVTLVSLPNHRTTIEKVNGEIDIIYLSVRGTVGYYLNAIELKKITARLRPDIINVHYASGYGTLARVAKLPNIILSVWGSDVYDFPYESKIKNYIIKKNLRYAYKIASTSYAMAEQVKKLIGEKEITVTPFGVDTSRFKKENSRTHAIFTIGVIKSLSYKYGIDTVIKAFALVQTYVNTNMRLIIYGEGEQKQKLIDLCQELQIGDDVEFRGLIPNGKVPEALNEIDVVCLGSRMESFGVAAVEAMACEVPVIATDVDGFREVIANNETGFIIPKERAEIMAEKIQKLYQNPGICKRMGQEGRKRVLKYYDWEDNVKKMLQLYLQVNTSN